MTNRQSMIITNALYQMGKNKEKIKSKFPFTKSQWNDIKSGRKMTAGEIMKLADFCQCSTEDLGLSNEQLNSLAKGISDRTRKAFGLERYQTEFDNFMILMRCR